MLGRDVVFYRDRRAFVGIVEGIAERVAGGYQYACRRDWRRL